MTATDANEKPVKLPGKIILAVRFLARLWIGWFLFSAVEMSCCFHLLKADNRYKPANVSNGFGGAWHGAQWLGFEVAAAAVWAVAIGFVSLILVWFVRLLHLPQRAALPLISILKILMIWVCLMLAGLSWGAYITNGTFLDRESIYFSFQLTHPLRLLFWTSPVVVSLLPVVSLAVVLGSGALIGYLQRRMSWRWTKVIAFGGLPLAIGLALLSTASDPAPQVPANVTNGQELLGTAQISLQSVWLNRRYHLGPCSAALLDLLSVGAVDDEIPQGTQSIAAVYRPQISMKEYLQGVNQQAVKKWNVVFVEVESMRADSLRLLGAKRNIMPFVDWLTDESLVFDHAYTQATHSNYAVGCPLASQYPLRSTQPIGYTANPAYPRVMIYDIFKALGYGVGLFSSGNEHWFGMNNFLQTPSVDAYQDAETWKGPTKIFAGDTGFAKWASQTNHHGIVDDRFTVQSAMDWMDQQQSRPFFMYLNFQASHFPYVVPEDFTRRFSSSSPPDFQMNFAGFPAEKADVVRGIYDDSLSYVDNQFAKLCQHIKDRGQWDNTVIVFTGDHGQAFYEHGFPTHANMLYNELVCVPLFIRVPHAPGRVDHDAIQHVDIAPILLHLMGLPPHPGQQGVDVLDPRSSRHHALYTMVQTPLADQFSIVLDSYKLIFGKKENAYALYDENADPGEKVNPRPTGARPSDGNEKPPRQLAVSATHVLPKRFISERVLRSDDSRPVTCDASVPTGECQAEFPMLKQLSMPGLFITATDTGVGKTVIASAIANWFFRRGRRTGVCKIAATGCQLRGEKFISEDAESLARASGGHFPLELICPIRYEEPLAPAVAAERAGQAVDWSLLQLSLNTMASQSDVMIVEGVGGVMVPMDERYTVLDVARWLALPTVVVVRPGLGTINHTLLTVNALRAAGVFVAGVVVNRYLSDSTDLAQATNVDAIQKWGKVPVLCVVPEGVGSAIDTVDWTQTASSSPLPTFFAPRS